MKPSAVVDERDKLFYAVTHQRHRIMNPVFPERWLRVGESLGLTSRTTVLDVGCGKGEPALLWAERFRCDVLGIDIHEEFVEEARMAAGDRGLTEHCRFLEGGGADVPYHFKGSTFDVVVALGVTFIFGRLHALLETLLPMCAKGGTLVVGEPTWNFTPVPSEVLEVEGVAQADFRTDLENLALIEQAGGELIGCSQVSREEWDWYESLQWQGALEHLRAHPHDRDAARIWRRIKRQREVYLRYGPRVMGMSLYLIRTPA